MSSIELIDFDNDLIDVFLGLSTNGVKATDLCLMFPSICFIEKDTFGVEKFCMIRINGEQCIISANNSGTGIYRPKINDFETYHLFGGHRIHRPKS